MPVDDEVGLKALSSSSYHSRGHIGRMGHEKLASEHVEVFDKPGEAEQSIGGGALKLLLLSLSLFVHKVQ